MEYFAGLDVGVKATAICVVNSAGAVVLEASAETTADAIHQALEGYARRLRRVGHEAGALSPWLHRGLQRLGLDVVLLETRHVHAALKAQRNKTDRNDARGVAQLVRSGWYRDVHVKSEDSYRLRLLLTHRWTLKRKPCCRLRLQSPRTCPRAGMRLPPRPLACARPATRGCGS